MTKINRKWRKGMRIRRLSRSFVYLVITSVMLLLPLVPGLVVVADADSPTPVLQSLNSTSPAPGAVLTVTGQNFGAIAAWRAVVELANGEKFEQTPQPVSNTQFKITVPNIYNGYNTTARKAEHRQRIQQAKFIYVKQNTKISNKLGFNITSLWSILDQINPASPRVGDNIIVNGGNWHNTLIYYPNQMYWAVFEYLPGKSMKTNIQKPPMVNPVVPVPYQPNTCLVGMLQIKVPDVYAGKSAAEQDAIAKHTGKLYIYGMFGPGAPSNALDIKIQKTATTTTTTNSCPGGKYFQGQTYMGQPSCSGTSALGAYLQCDATGYYCCASAQGASSKCGSGKYVFQPGCTQWSSGGGSNVGPLVQNGVFYGCYKNNP